MFPRQLHPLHPHILWSQNFSSETGRSYANPELVVQYGCSVNQLWAKAVGGAVPLSLVLVTLEEPTALRNLHMQTCCYQLVSANSANNNNNGSGHLAFTTCSLISNVTSFLAQDSEGNLKSGTSLPRNHWGAQLPQRNKLQPLQPCCAYGLFTASL